MDVHVRAAAPDDLPVLVEARRMMFADLYGLPPEDVSQTDALLREWMRPRMADGRAFGFIAEDETGRWHGALSVAREEVPPSLGNPAGVQHYVFGLWVRHESRRRGIAESLVRSAVESARAEGAGAVALYASDEGRPLYAKIGFDTAAFMRLFFAPLEVRRSAGDAGA